MTQRPSQGPTIDYPKHIFVGSYCKVLYENYREPRRIIVLVVDGKDDMPCGDYTSLGHFAQNLVVQGLGKCLRRKNILDPGKPSPCRRKIAQNSQKQPRLRHGCDSNIACKTEGSDFQGLRVFKLPHPQSGDELIRHVKRPLVQRGHYVSTAQTSRSPHAESSTKACADQGVPVVPHSELGILAARMSLVQASEGTPMHVPAGSFHRQVLCCDIPGIA